MSLAIAVPNTNRPRPEKVMEILIVEDDGVMGKALHKGLMEAGHNCRWVKDGTEGLQVAISTNFDLILLDIMMPGLSGLELLKQYRKSGNKTPVILLTALGSVEERVTGLRAGADDYLVKPFALAELMARIEAVCRRTNNRPATTMQVADLMLDLSTRRVRRGEHDI